MLLCGSSLGLYLLCNDLSLLLLPTGRFLLHPDQLRIPLPVLFVFVRGARPGQLVVVFRQLCLGLCVLLHGFPLLIPPHPLHLLKVGTYMIDKMDEKEELRYKNW
jgi:hypothetical protein